MKYVMFRKREGADLVSFFPVIFSEGEIHAVIAEGVIHGQRRNKVLVEAVSAGFMSFRGMLAICDGKSESMGLEYHPEDGPIITMGDSARYMWDAREGCKVYHGH